MKVLLLVLISLSVCNYISVQEINLNNPIWNNYKKNFNKTFSSQKDEVTRYLYFLNSLRKVNAQNLEYTRGKSTYSQKLYKFSDWSQAEVTKQLKGLKIPSNLQNPTKSLVDTSILSRSTKQKSAYSLIVDWRSNLPPVEDQGYCGSCWAFSTGHVVEGCRSIKINNPLSTSKQQILDCSKMGNGCYGGWPADVLRDFASNNFSFVNSSQYPYTGTQVPCQTQMDGFPIFTVYPENEVLSSESDLISMVANYGPVAVAVSATIDFQNYDSGVFDEPSCKAGGCWSVDHAVTIVGYNMSAPVPYWIVKNSWSSGWGENGYIRMAMNKNTCNVGCFGVTVTC